jgi:DNA-binding NarL/FixJ family response regulator
MIFLLNRLDKTKIHEKYVFFSELPLLQAFLKGNNLSAEDIQVKTPSLENKFVAHTYKYEKFLASVIPDNQFSLITEFTLTKLAEGYTIKEIARMRGSNRSVKGVEWHVSNIKKLFNIKNRHNVLLTHFAIALGLVTPPNKIQ